MEGLANKTLKCSTYQEGISRGGSNDAEIKLHNSAEVRAVARSRSSLARRRHEICSKTTSRRRIGR